MNFIKSLFKEDIVSFLPSMLTNKTHSVKRGKNESTIYLLIPKEIRTYLKPNKIINFGLIEKSKTERYLIIKLK